MYNASDARREDGGFVVTLVHGTYATEAPWTAEGSAVREKIASALKGQVIFERFCWSGANNIFDRSHTAAGLVDALRMQERTHPRCKRIVIAHSHAGNIAVEAITSMSDRMIDGLACLSTPFFHYRFKDELVEEPGFLPRAWSGLFCLLAFIYYVFWQPPYLALGMILVCAVVGGNLLGRFFAAGINAGIANLKDLLPGECPNARRPPVLILREAGDEASLALGMGQLFDWLSSSLYRRIVARSGTLDIAILPGRWRPLLILAAAAGVATLWFFVSKSSAERQDPAIIAIYARIIAGLLFAAALLKTRLFDNFLLGFSTIFAIASSLFQSFWFGTKLPRDMNRSWVLKKGAGLLLATFLEVRTEASPLGEWAVTYVPPSTILPDPIDGRLTHSVYNNPAALERLAVWLAANFPAQRIAQATAASPTGPHGV